MENLIEFLKGLNVGTLEYNGNLYIILDEDEKLYYMMDLRHETYISSLDDILPVRYLLTLPDVAMERYSSVRLKVKESL